MSFADNPIFKPSNRMLRQFSAIWIVFFAAIALRQELHQHHVLAAVLALLAVVVGPMGLVWPRAIRPIFVGWITLAYPIGWIVSRVMLGIMFYGLLTPIALVFRMAGRDVLQLKPQPQAATYWRTKQPAADKSKYLRQF